MFNTRQVTAMMLHQKGLWLLLVGVVITIQTSAVCAAKPELNQVWNEDGLDVKLENLMRKKISVNFQGAPLDEVMARLRKQLDVNLVVNWTALQQVGIERSAPVTLELKDIPAQKVMDVVLEMADAAGGFDPLNWIIIDGMVKVSTASDTRKPTIVEHYDVRDLVGVVYAIGPMFRPFDLNAALGGASGGGGVGKKPDADSDKDLGLEPHSTLEAMESLTDLMRSNIGAPTEWEAAGGEVSSISHITGQLIVRTTKQNHVQVEAVLKELRSGGNEDSKRTLMGLEKKISVDFEEVNLKDVIDHFRKQYKLNIFVNWRHFRDVDVTPKTTVNATLKDVPLGHVLGLILHGAGDGVVYTVDQGVIVIFVDHHLTKLLSDKAATESKKPKLPGKTLEKNAPPSKAKSNKPAASKPVGQPPK